ncbi:MAG: cation diffusion facilitator family transporter [Methanocellales archaeon]|nr:cation diffusion facilitator family transporter [Methanocellales archaeon]MDD3292427.1 cation diffusion facilitator family transporter [Methanocellales archaeon]MDD5236013.1 cation diffusion facilitator family transporter [Methanocellales archaeon]MDD5485881.1 cation diffusion facilitator family transporter [Methanocellales archaeon]
MDLDERNRVGQRISGRTLIVNVVLSSVKILAGVIGQSSAMVADGFHTLSDVMSTIAVMIGLKISSKPQDETHPYGHEKLESVTAKVLAVILFATAIFIGYGAIEKIILRNLSTPGLIAIYAAILSIFVKEWMYRYTIKGARRIESSAMLADAWHHRSDALSSIGALIGIFGARLGILILDPLASLIIGVFIAKVAVDIYLRSIKEVVDHAADKEVIDKIRNEILNVEGVLGIDDLKSRIHVNRLYVDVEIRVKNDIKVDEAHEIAEEVHLKVEDDPKVKHCMVHVNPSK